MQVTYCFGGNFKIKKSSCLPCNCSAQKPRWSQVQGSGYSAKTDPDSWGSVRKMFSAVIVSQLLSWHWLSSMAHVCTLTSVYLCFYCAIFLLLFFINVYYTVSLLPMIWEESFPSVNTSIYPVINRH